MSDTGKTRGTLLLEDGAAGFPSLAAYARQGDGMWFNSTGIHFSVAGTEVFAIASTGPAPVGSLLLNNGTAAAPSLAFLSAGNNNTGLFLKAADALGFAANGVEVGSYSAAGLFTLGASGGTQTHAVNGSLTATVYFKVANAGDPGAVTDAIAIGSFDLSAGNATLSLRTETAVVTETVVSDATLSVQINGVTYKICLKA